MSIRTIGISNLFKLIRTESKLPLIGLVLIIFSAVVLFPFMTLQVSTITKEFKKYDYSSLDENGTEYTGRVTSIEVVDNVTINGRHPYSIGYAFTYNNNERQDQFMTTDWRHASDLNDGDEIVVIANDEMSKIKGFSTMQIPYQMFYIFYIFPVLVLLVGIILILIGLIPALKIYNIYKNGVVKDGIIEMMIPKGKNVLVTFSYEGMAGQKLFGKSTVKSNEIYAQKKLNDAIKVFVLPTNEKKAALVPFNNSWGIA